MFKLKRTWEIQPTDIHWLGFEASFIVANGWEPYGVSPVPNTLDQNQVRLWLRRRPPRFWHRKQREIKIQSAGWGGHQILLHLSSGWEPFGVSISPPDQPIVWFRRAA
jgi:hypothetical protein